MPLPRSLTYNDLTGEEVKHILVQRMEQVLADVPYLQKHITLPRVKMTLHIELDCWADQSTRETKHIQDEVDVLGESYSLVTSVDSSPKGDPPDKIREDHGLGVPTPRRGAMAVEDTVEGRRYQMPNGAIVDRTGANTKTQGNATVIEQDFGPARNGRPEVARGTRGPVTPPNFKEFQG